MGSLKNGGGISVDEIQNILYHTIIESSKDRFMIIDREFRIIWANGEKAASQVIGKTCFRLYQGGNRPCPDCPISRVFGSCKSIAMEKWVGRRRDKRRWNEIRAYPIHDDKGNTVLAMKIGYDITAKKIRFDEQKEHVRSLEERLKEIAKSEIPERLACDNNGIQPNFTSRQFEVLRLMTKGYTNIEMSKSLMVSPNTVKTHVVSIFNKLGINDRTQAAVWATRHNLV